MSLVVDNAEQGREVGDLLFATAMDLTGVLDSTRDALAAHLRHLGAIALNGQYRRDGLFLDFGGKLYSSADQYKTTMGTSLAPSSDGRGFLCLASPSELHPTDRIFEEHEVIGPCCALHHAYKSLADFRRERSAAGRRCVAAYTERADKRRKVTDSSDVTVLEEPESLQATIFECKAISMDAFEAVLANATLTRAEQLDRFATLHPVSRKPLLCTLPTCRSMSSPLPLHAPTIRQSTCIASSATRQAATVVRLAIRRQSASRSPPKSRGASKATFCSTR